MAGNRMHAQAKNTIVVAPSDLWDDQWTVSTSPQVAHLARYETRDEAEAIARLIARQLGLDVIIKENQ